MTVDPLDMLKYVVLMAEVRLTGVEDAEGFLDDLDWLAEPFGSIDESSIYSDGSPIVMRAAVGGVHYNLPPGFKPAVAS